MAKVAGNARFDWAQGHAAVNGRYAWKDLSYILNAQQSAQQARRATETRSLSQGTAGWAKITHPHRPAVDGEEPR